MGDEGLSISREKTWGSFHKFSRFVTWGGLRECTRQTNKVGDEDKWIKWGRRQERRRVVCQWQVLTKDWKFHDKLGVVNPNISQKCRQGKLLCFIVDIYERRGNFNLCFFCFFWPNNVMGKAIKLKVDDWKAWIDFQQFLPCYGRLVPKHFCQQPTEWFSQVLMTFLDSKEIVHGEQWFPSYQLNCCCLIFSCFPNYREKTSGVFVWHKYKWEGVVNNTFSKFRLPCPTAWNFMLWDNFTACQSLSSVNSATFVMRFFETLVWILSIVAYCDGSCDINRQSLSSVSPEFLLGSFRQSPDYILYHLALPLSGFWMRNFNCTILSTWKLNPAQGEGFEGGHQVVITGENLVPDQGEFQKEVFPEINCYRIHNTTLSMIHFLLTFLFKERFLHGFIMESFF